MTGPHRPPSALAALLDALEVDLLAAPAEEVRDVLHGTGRARDGACQEVRALLQGAAAADENSSPVATPHGLGIPPGLHRH